MEKNVLLIRTFIPFCTLCVVLILSGCGSKDMSPRAIQPEVDTCAVCNMSITHEEFAAQAILTNGDKLIFDDLGCLVQYVLDKQESEIGASYIKDYESNEWIDTTKASFVYHKDFWTPMTYGVLAFESEQRAVQFIKNEGQGKLLTQQDLQEHKWGVHKYD
ncbi:nitrous oxide reductase accessory protein NosL [Paenisporosarcina sp. TG-14]|uniref:nitrous oxide reductase accessory protein NosL n=1 Tax=Paenisporosarcina sp. TG-14 TaxID=1231057 RepID=UPI00036E1940|nr:nitrous oxide reductase accessory protein NosL [Paenisporosarcina sp. TG-14]